MEEEPKITYNPWADKFCVYYSGKKDGEKRFKEFSKYVGSTKAAIKSKEEFKDRNNEY